MKKTYHPVKLYFAAAACSTLMLAMPVTASYAAYGQTPIGQAISAVVDTASGHGRPDTVTSSVNRDSDITGNLANEADRSDERTYVSGAAASASSHEDSRIADWYADTVFVGDSIMQGFRSYAASRGGWLGGLKFLSSGNFSVYNALHSGVQPLYLGEKVTVWDGVKKMGARRIFIELGLNDFNLDTPEKNAEAYEDFVQKILEVNPGTDIHIISMTYTAEGVSNGSLNNDAIRAYNRLLRRMAEKHGWGYVDLAEPLSDGDGNLSPVYCSDDYVHQTEAAYDLWTKVLQQYAADRLGLKIRISEEYAGEWVADETGIRYRKADGTFMTEGWHWIDDDHDGVAECYYFYADGCLAYNARTPDRYYVNAKGQWEVNGKVKTEKVAVY